MGKSYVMKIERRFAWARARAIRSIQCGGVCVRGLRAARLDAMQCHHRRRPDWPWHSFLHKKCERVKTSLAFLRYMIFCECTTHLHNPMFHLMFPIIADTDVETLNTAPQKAQNYYGKCLSPIKKLGLVVT